MNSLVSIKEIYFALQNILIMKILGPNGIIPI